jgi:hypothetical protein
MHISKPKYEFKDLAESLKLRALQMIDSFLILIGLRLRKVEIAEEDRYLLVKYFCGEFVCARVCTCVLTCTCGCAYMV